MRTIYNICEEINDRGFSNSDKTFTNQNDAILYLRKLVAKDLRFYRREGYKIIYLNIYKSDPNSSFPQTIEFGIKKGLETNRFDVRVKESILFEDKSEFNKYPIQF